MAAAPATAITEPTERSIPAVEITKVIPVAIIRYRADSWSMVISGPARPPVLLFQLKARKSCWKMVQMMTRRMNATIDQVRLLLSSFLTKLLPSAFAFQPSHASFPVFTLVLAMVSTMVA